MGRGAFSTTPAHSNVSHSMSAALVAASDDGDVACAGVVPAGAHYKAPSHAPAVPPLSLLTGRNAISRFNFAPFGAVSKRMSLRVCCCCFGVV
jgi:hypothetical protein